MDCNTGVSVQYRIYLLLYYVCCYKGFALITELEKNKTILAFLFSVVDKGIIAPITCFTFIFGNEMPYFVFMSNRTHSNQHSVISHETVYMSTILAMNIFLFS